MFNRNFTEQTDHFAETPPNCPKNSEIALFDHLVKLLTH